MLTIKIVQINSTCGIGSTGKICVAVSELLNQENIENYVFYFHSTDGNKNGVECATKSYLKGQAIKSRILGNWGFNSKGSTNRIIKKLQEIKPDIVHLHNLHSHDCNLEVLFSYFKKVNQKLYWTFHDCWAFTGYCMYFSEVGCKKWQTECDKCPLKWKHSFLKDNSKKLFKKKMELFSNLDLTIITPSKWMANLVKKSFLKDYPVKVINNGIDLSVFKPTKSDFREKYNIPKDKKILLGVAHTWQKRKGIDTLYNLSKKIDKNKYQLVLVGENPFKAFGPKNIIFINKTANQKELAKIYSAADLFVNPTREETLGMVNIEALACGTPVITYNSGGSIEMLDEKCGVVVECDDFNTLKSEIERLCEKDSLSSDECVRKAKDFANQNRMKEYFDLYVDYIDGMAKEAISETKESRRVLWIANMVLPVLANHLNIKTSASGTWMEDLSQKISELKDIKLAVACVYGNEFKKVEVENIIFYLIPGNGKTMLFYNKDIVKYWREVEKDFNPDIVHIHGTEYSHSISYLREFTDKKYLLTIQGIISKIAEKNDGELSFFTKLKHRTFRENAHLNGIFENKALMKHNSKHEKEIINSVKYVTGRTDWDKAFLKAVNPNIKYYRVFYNLRDAFYNCPKWDIKKAEPHTIYASTSASSPLKGGHVVLKALKTVKEKYPDLKAIFIAPADENKKIVVNSGYTKYISKLIKRYNLEDNLEFYNRLSADQIINAMERSRCCIVPSAMENASATLRESMDLGVPSIASYRGGMVDLIKNNVNGLFFNFNEPEYLAEKIIGLFEDDELCNTLSKNAIESAAVWHNRTKNIDDMIAVYKSVMEDL